MSYTAPLGNSVNFTTPGEAGYVAPSGNAVNFTSYGVPGFFAGGKYSLSGSAVAASGVAVVSGGMYALSGEALAFQAIRHRAVRQHVRVEIQVDMEPERRPPVWLAVERDIATHLFNQFLRDNQPQARTTVTP